MYIYSVHQLMPLKLRVIQEPLSACWDLADVHPLTMSHLMLSVGACMVYKIKVLTLISEYLAAIIFSALVFPCFASFGVNFRNTAHFSTSHPVLIIIFLIEAFNFFLNSVQISIAWLDSLLELTIHRFWAEQVSLLGVFLSLQR